MNIPDKAIGAAETAWYEAADLEDALKAAAPYIAAQALRDVIGNPGMRQRLNTDYGYVEETVYSRDMLASRADELDPL